jgi:hypothetical protein
MLFIVYGSSSDVSVFFVIRKKHLKTLKNRETETGGPVSVEQRINIFQAAYKESVKCKSSQPRGFGYMAKLPTCYHQILAKSGGGP